MKLNGWSVVKTPLGISLRPIDGHGEICVREDNGFYNIAVHADIARGLEENAVSETRIPISLLTAKE